MVEIGGRNANEAQIQSKTGQKVGKFSTICSVRFLQNKRANPFLTTPNEKGQDVNPDPFG